MFIRFIKFNGVVNLLTNVVQAVKITEKFWAKFYHIISYVHITYGTDFFLYFPHELLMIKKCLLCMFYVIFQKLINNS